MVSDNIFRAIPGGVVVFQSALRFAVVSDWVAKGTIQYLHQGFQSALRFAVVSDSMNVSGSKTALKFQSALRFAVVSDEELHPE